MAKDSVGWRLRTAAVILFGVAVGAAFGGMSLLVTSLGGIGSRGGSVVLGGLGVILLVLSPALCIFGLIAWRGSARPE